MREMREEKRLLLLPVRRRLMAAAMAYMLGILTASIVVFPIKFIGILSALFFVPVCIRLARRKSVLFYVLALMLLFGHLRAGTELNTHDLPTQPGVMIEGTVARIEKPYRVYLRDVYIDGEAANYERGVVVTLMQEEDMPAPDQPRVGQIVSGRGRLFAPDEKRNPGGVDWRISSICKGYELSGYLLSGWQVRGNAVFSLHELLRGLRISVGERIALLFGDQAALFQGIMLGDKSALEDEVTAAMRLTGTAHILTVSGLHLSMIAAAASALLGIFPLRRKQRFALLGVFLVLFTGLTGAAAGTIRACIMALMRELALVRGRRYEPLTALAFAALCMTLVQPLWLLNASFQFSFFVVLAIQLFSLGISSFASRRLHVRGLWAKMVNVLSVSLSAQIGSVPMQLMLYGYVSLLSLPMNVLCGGLMMYLLLGGWLCVLVSVLWLEAGACLAALLAYVSAAFEALSLLAASHSAATLRLPAPYGVTVLLLLALFLLLSSRIRLGSLRRHAAAMITVLVCITYLVRFDPQCRYVQLDVGQGDAALFRNGRRAVLMDVGPAQSYEMLRYLRHEGLFVDALILSHPDEDHAGALDVLLSSEVGIPDVVIARGAQQEAQSQTVIDAFDVLRSKAIPVHEVNLGDRIDVCGVTFNVLAPNDSAGSSNERSLLLHAVAQSVSFLLTGDLPIEQEPTVVPRVDVLKVAHHGSKNSTSDTFAHSASPSLALISVGRDNRYGHPHQRVLDALKGTQILRTDRHGCITLRLKEGSCKIDTFFPISVLTGHINHFQSAGIPVKASK